MTMDSLRSIEFTCCPHVSATTLGKTTGGCANSGFPLGFVPSQLGVNLYTYLLCLCTIATMHLASVIDRSVLRPELRPNCLAEAPAEAVSVTFEYIR